MSTTERIRIVLIRRKMTVTALAAAVGLGSRNLGNKLSKDDFRESELQKIAEALNCTLGITFTLRDTGETI
ncbi:hypothetical protein FACS1894208_12880 [Clostridia bacterium]|nr:hypothetical protein FACS1894208_12880 [Clostridia bacterium]